MEIKERINGYVKEVEKSNSLYTVGVEYGRKYAKIVHTHYGQTSVHSFVDLLNGDVLKAASWSAPAKHARANIFDEDFGASALTEYGIIYLK